MQKIVSPCTVCSKTKPGWLWLGGGDYAECPNCQGTGKVEVHEYKVRKGLRITSQAGVGTHTVVTDKLFNWS